MRIVKPGREGKRLAKKAVEWDCGHCDAVIESYKDEGRVELNSDYNDEKDTLLVGVVFTCPYCTNDEWVAIWRFHP